MAIAEHDVKIKKLRYERVGPQNGGTRKYKLQASFNCSTDMELHLFLPF